MRAKPKVSPPECATSRLHSATIMHYYSYRTLTPSAEYHQNSVAMATPFEDRNTNVRLIVYSHRSINPENLTKIGLADVEIPVIVGLTGITHTHTV